jgi:transposase
MPRETSAAIGELFRGFSGYVQADAKSVYDLLFKPAAERPPLGA